MIYIKRPVALIIMDGFGIAPPSEYNAVYKAGTPYLDSIISSCPNSRLIASGEDVGLPAGQIGNSEVGHTNIGAGRIVYQDLSRISLDIKNGGFFKNPAYNGIMEAVKARGTSLHIMGLTSPGGVHSHCEHLWALIKLAAEKGLSKVYIHCFTDGRDVPPKSGIDTISQCTEVCRKYGTGKIATIIGRFYAMDRDKRWERVKEAYDALVSGKGQYNPDPVDAMERSYAAGVTDEFVKPVICDRDGRIREGDGIIFINFRPDRARELTRAFTDPDFDGFERSGGYFPVDFVCTATYDDTMPNVSVAYPPHTPENTLGQVVSAAGLTQLRIAETEKYAHVTFFFNGGVEEVFPGEDRILIPSPKEFPTYDLIPEMSAHKLADRTCEEIRSGKYDLIILNFANCDMVGHTGVMEAAVKAVSTVDACVKQVTEAILSAGGIALITADHGNAEKMMDEDGKTPHTAHTTNLVPFIAVGRDLKLRDGRLCDIAPTILELMGIAAPGEMTGNSLIDNG